MFPRAMTIARLRGIDVRIDASWLLIAALVTWSFWIRFAVLADRPGGVALAMAGIAAAGLFLSVLAHEFAHALEARHRGVEVHGITLFIFGGVSEMKFDVKRPRDEFAITAIGPFTSLVLAGIFGITATVATTADAPALAEIAGLLGWLNLALGLFNLLPGAPLDGGRILRALVWWVTGDRRRSIRAAAAAGWLVGAVIMAAGLAQFLFVRGGVIGGLWFLLIGWFLFRSATTERLQADLQGRLEGVSVRRLLPDPPSGVPANTTADQAVDFFYRTPADVLPVVEADRVVGIIGMDELRRLPHDERPYTRVAEVMRHPESLPKVTMDDDASRLLDLLGAEERMVLAHDGDRPAGVVTQADVTRALHRIEVLENGARR